MEGDAVRLLAPWGLSSCRELSVTTLSGRARAVEIDRGDQSTYPRSLPTLAEPLQRLAKMSAPSIPRRIRFPLRSPTGHHDICIVACSRARSVFIDYLGTSKALSCQLLTIMRVVHWENETELSPCYQIAIFSFF